MNSYTKEDIVSALKNAGLEKGADVFCHSNIGFFGKLEGALNMDEYCKTFFEAFFEVIGQKGTLVVPTFTYSFCHKEIFDVQNTKTNCGAFSEYVRKQDGAIRSKEGNFSVCALGKNAEFFTENPPENPFGENSFFDKFYKTNGVFCNFNFDSGSTFIHYVEKSLKVPYRWDKPFKGKLVDNGVEEEKTFYHFVYDLDKINHEPDFTKFDKKAKELNLTKTANLGRGTVLVISAKDTFDLIKNEFKTTPNFLIKGEI